MADSNSARPRMEWSRLLPDVRWGLLPILLVPVVVSFWPQSKVLVTEQPDDVAAEMTDSADFYMLEAKMSALDDTGRLLYQVRAEEILHYPDDSVTASPLEIEYVGPEGHWQLNAPHGRLPPQSKELLLSGGVIINGRRNQNQPLTTMLMDNASLHTDLRQLDTDAPVSIDEATRQVRAVGMTMNMDKDIVKLKNKVRVYHAP